MKTIQLKTSKGAVLNIGICSDSLMIMGEKYYLNGMTDIARLSIFADDMAMRQQIADRIRPTSCCDDYRDENLPINKPEPE